MKINFIIGSISICQAKNSTHFYGGVGFKLRAVIYGRKYWAIKRKFRALQRGR